MLAHTTIHLVYLSAKHMFKGGGCSPCLALPAQNGCVGTYPLDHANALGNRCSCLIYQTIVAPLLHAGSDVLAMLYVSLLGGAAGYGIYFYNATHGSLTSLSSLTFLTPVFASATGFLAMGETMTPLQLAGGAVTLVSVGLINKKPTDSQPQVAATPLASNKADGQ